MEKETTKKEPKKSLSVLLDFFDVTPTENVFADIFQLISRMEDVKEKGLSKSQKDKITQFIFETVDKDNSGYIDAIEMKDVLTHFFFTVKGEDVDLSEGWVSEAIKVMDTDGSGKIEYKEFKAFIDEELWQQMGDKI